MQSLSKSEMRIIPRLGSLFVFVCVGFFLWGDKELHSVYAAPRPADKAATEIAKPDYAKLLQDTKTASDAYAKEYQDLVNFTGTDVQKKQMKAALDQALNGLFKTASAALSAAPDNANPEEIAFLRYSVCSYYTVKKHYFEAIVLAMSISEINKDIYGRRAEIIALKSYMQIKNELNVVKNQNPQKAAEVMSEISNIKNQIGKIATHVTQTWPKSDEADEARLILVSAAIEENNFAEAKKLIESIDPKQPLRLNGEILLGTHATQKFYNLKYGKDAESGKPANTQELALLSPLVHEMLPKSLAEAQKQRLDSQGVLGTYLYLRLLLKENRPADGLALINHPQEGLLAKLQNDSPDIPDAYAFDMMRVIFQVLIKNDKATEAIKIVNMLDERAGKNAEQKKLLTSFLIAAGSDLYTQIKTFQTEQNADKARSTADALDTLIGKIPAQSLASDIRLMVWLADTYSSLAEVNSEKAEDYLAKSGKLFDEIVEMGEKDPKSIAPFTVLALKVKQINLMRNRKDYDGVVVKYKDLLRVNPSLMILQKEAANALQQMGEDSAAGSKERYNFYLEAISGVPERRDSAPVIWGWSKLAQTVYRNENFKEKEESKNFFFEARLHIAQCRYALAMENTADNDKKQKHLVAAKDLIFQDYNQVDKNLGGEARKKEYEELLIEIQKALGQEPLGLKEATQSVEKSAPESDS